MFVKVGWGCLHIWHPMGDQLFYPWLCNINASSVCAMMHFWLDEDICADEPELFLEVMCMVHCGSIWINSFRLGIIDMKSVNSLHTVLVIKNKFMHTASSYFLLTFASFSKSLTHWGRVTHTCISKLTIIGSENSLSPSRRQAIIWANAAMLSIRP